MLTDVRHCPECGDERDFVQPPCPDGHGEDCADRACVDCGAAVWVGAPVAVQAERLVPHAA